MGDFRKWLVVGVLAFIVGASGATYWYLTRSIPVVTAPVLFVADDVAYVDESQISPRDQKFWNDEILARFDERPIGDTDSSVDESYRLILLPTFDPPILVRAERNGEKKFISVKILDGKGGYGLEKLGNLAINESHPLTDEEWKKFSNLMGQASFWWTPSRIPDEVAVMDGATWVFEGSKRGEHHMVIRTTPGPALLGMCSYLVKLAGREEEYKGYKPLS